MIVVKINLADYAISMDYLNSLAIDFFGRLLAIADDDDSVEFGFEGDTEFAAMQKISTIDMSKQNAHSFELILNSPTWKIVKNSS